jgi:hypothetical protein
LEPRFCPGGFSWEFSSKGDFPATFFSEFSSQDDPALMLIG